MARKMRDIPGKPEMIVNELLDRGGSLYAEDAGIKLADRPGPLYQLLVLATLLSAPIPAETGIGPTGASIFLREVQDTWPAVAPYVDAKVTSGARREIALRPRVAGQAAGGQWPARPARRRPRAGVAEPAPGQRGHRGRARLRTC
jgi:hypothetical protein